MNIKQYFISLSLILSFFGLNQTAFAQNLTCNTPFLVADTVCASNGLNVNFPIPTGATINWDFCAGSAFGNVTMTEFAPLIQSNFVSGLQGLQIVKDGPNYHGFFVAPNSNYIFRIDFGTRLNNPNPNITPIFALDNNITNPGNLGLVLQSDGWYAIIGNRNYNSFYKLNFPNSITVNPRSSFISTSYNIGRMSISRSLIDAGNTYTLGASENDIGLNLFFHGNSIANTALSSRYFNTTSPTKDLDIINHCGEYIAFLITSTNRILKLNFGSSLSPTSSPPSIVDITSVFPSTITEFTSIHTLSDKGQLLVFAMSKTGATPIIAMHRGVFSLGVNNLPIVTNTIIPNAVAPISSLEISRDSTGTYVGLGLYNAIIPSLQKLVRFNFSSDCDAYPSFSTSPNQLAVSYTTPNRNKLITATVKLANGQTYQYFDSVYITTGISAKPIASRVCGSTAVAFADSSCSSLNDNLSYLWNFGDGNSSTLQKPSHVYNRDSTYLISLTVNSQTSSITRTTKLAYQKFRPSPRFSFNDGVCATLPVSFTNSSFSTLDTIRSYFWQFDTLGTSTLANPVFTFPRNGVYTVTLKVTGKSGCDSSISQSITIFPKPNPLIAVRQVCFGDTTLFFDSTDSRFGPYTYLWNFGDGTNSTLQNPKKKFAGQGMYPITLTLTTGNGCTTTSTRNVMVNPLPRANLRIVGNSFTGDSVRFADSSLAASQSISRWNWIFSDANSSDTTARGQQVAHLFSQPGTYKVTLKILTNQGCKDSISKFITVRLSCPVISITASRNTDVNTPLPITLTSGGAARAKYDFCEGDLANQPFGLSFGIATTNNNRITFIKDQGKHYAFLTNNGESNAGNQFIRLDFDSSLSRIPRSVLLGNPQFALNGPCQMQFLKEGANWYGLTTNSNGGNNNLVRLNFGSSINSAAITSTSLNLNGAINRPNGFELVRDGDSIYAFVCNSQPNNQNSSFVRLAFGNSVTNTPRATSITNSLVLQSGSNLTSVFAFKNCNFWHVFITAFNGQVYRLDHGTSLSSTPIVVNITNNLNVSSIPASSLLNLMSVNVHRDQGFIYMYLTNNTGNVIRVKYPNDVRATPLSVENQTNWGIMQNSTGLTFVKDNSVWYTFTTERSNRLLYRFRYANNCSAPVTNIDTTSSASISTTYSSPGTYYYSVAGADAFGNEAVLSDSVIVSGNAIPSSICPSTTLTLADQSCVSAPLGLIINSPSASTVEVDACVGDLAFNPTQLPNSGTLIPNVFSQFDLVKDGTDYFGFLYTGGESRLSRFSYGNSLESAPVITEFPNVVTSQTALKLFKSNGSWFGLSTGLSTNLISFGNRLTNAPSFTLLGTGSTLRTPKAIDIAQYKNQSVLVVTNQGGPYLTLVRFGNDFSNIPELDTVNIAGASSTSGVSMMQQCNIWYGIATDYNGNGFITFSFPNGLNNAPVVARVPNSVCSLTQPVGCKLVRDGATYYLFVSVQSGDLYRIKLGNDLSNPIFSTPNNLGNFSNLISAVPALPIERMNNSQWFLMTYGLNRNAIRLKFPNNCATIPAIYNVSNPTIRYTSSGTFNVGITVKDADGNINFASDSVVIRNPIYGQIGIGGQRCVLGLTTFSDQSLSSNPIPPVRQWNFGDTLATVIQSNSTNPSHQYIRAGNYTVTLRLIESGGCTAVVTRQVQIVNKPKPNFTFRANNCTNDSILFTDASIPGLDTIRSWVYRYNGVIVSRSRNFSLFFTDPGYYDINLTITGAAGCDTSITKTVFVSLPGPFVEFNTPTKTCFGDVTNFNGIVNASGNPIESQTWSLDPGVFRNTVNTQYLYTSPGTRRVTLTVRLTNGCSRTFDRQITIYRKPVGIITVGNQPCVGFPVQFDYNLSLLEGRVARQLWTFSDGTTDTLKNPIKIFPGIGTFFANVRITTNAGCETVIYDTIIVSPAPKANFSFRPRCAGRFTSFIDSSDANNLPGGITSYAWDFGNGQTSNSPIPDSVRYDNPSRYSVTLTVTANGCSNTKRIQILIPPSPDPVVSVQEGCEGVPYIFTDSSTVSGVYMPSGSRIWTIDGRTYTSRRVSVLLTAGQNYDVQLQSTSPEGCSNTLPKSISVGFKPIARFKALDTIFTTRPYSVRFQNRSQNAYKYLWKFGDGDTSQQFSPTHIYATEGVYTVTLIAYRNTQCYDSTSIIINVISNIRPDLQLLNLNTSVQNGLMSVTVTLKNTGNVEIRSAELLLQLNQQSTISENFKGSILPNAQFTYTFSARLVDSLNKPNSILCVEARTSVNGISDVTSDDNRLCKALNAGFNILDIFPNPTSNSLTLNYTLPREGSLSIKLVDGLGRNVLDLLDKNKAAGVYKETYDLTTAQSGIYHVQFIFENEVRNLRIIKF